MTIVMYCDTPHLATETVDQSGGEYVRGNAHINTAEGHLSQLKRSIEGTHDHVSERHPDRYSAEFDYQRNTRKQKTERGQKIG